MKKSVAHLSKYRIKEGPLGSDDSYGMNGAFSIPLKASKSYQYQATVVASNGMGWEHVSVSFPNRCPGWEEMCEIRYLFWEENEVVMQLHPAKAQNINNHPFCLHLWKPISVFKRIPTPPKIMVGI